MTFRLDRGSRTDVLVLCDDCAWRAGALGAGQARRLAADHELRAHPDQDVARDTLHAATRRARR